MQGCRLRGVRRRMEFEVSVHVVDVVVRRVRPFRPEHVSDVVAELGRPVQSPACVPRRVFRHRRVFRELRHSVAENSVCVERIFLREPSYQHVVVLVRAGYGSELLSFAEPSHVRSRAVDRGHRHGVFSRNESEFVRSVGVLRLKNDAFGHDVVRRHLDVVFREPADEVRPLAVRPVLRRERVVGQRVSRFHVVRGRPRIQRTAVQVERNRYQVLDFPYGDDFRIVVKIHGISLMNFRAVRRSPHDEVVSVARHGRKFVNRLNFRIVDRIFRFEIERFDDFAARRVEVGLVAPVGVVGRILRESLRRREFRSMSRLLFGKVSDELFRTLIRLWQRSYGLSVRNDYLERFHPASVRVEVDDRILFPIGVQLHVVVQVSVRRVVSRSLAVGLRVPSVETVSVAVRYLVLRRRDVRSLFDGQRFAFASALGIERHRDASRASPLRVEEVDSVLFLRQHRDGFRRFVLHVAFFRQHPALKNLVAVFEQVVRKSVDVRVFKSYRLLNVVEVSFHVAFEYQVVFVFPPMSVVGELRRDVSLFQFRSAVGQRVPSEERVSVARGFRKIFDSLVRNVDSSFFRRRSAVRVEVQRRSLSIRVRHFRIPRRSNFFRRVEFAGGLSFPVAVRKFRRGGHESPVFSESYLGNSRTGERRRRVRRRSHVEAGQVDGLQRLRLVENVRHARRSSAAS